MKKGEEKVTSLGTNDKGENIVVKERLIQSSPIPRIIVVLLFLLALGSLAQQLYYQHGQTQKTNQALSDLKKNQDALDQTQKDAEQDRENLRNLILAVGRAKTPTDVQTAINNFLNQAKKNDASRARRDSSSGRTTPKPSQGGTSQPAPRPGPSMGPSPSGSPHPTSTPSPTPSPTPTPLLPVGPTICHLTGVLCNNNVIIFSDRFGRVIFLDYTTSA